MTDSRTIEPTDHELVVLVAYLEAGTVRDAAHALRLGETTVRNHLANIRAKVGATNTAHAVYLLNDRLPRKSAA